MEDKHVHFYTRQSLRGLWSKPLTATSSFLSCMATSTNIICVQYYDHFVHNSATIFVTDSELQVLVTSYSKFPKLQAHDCLDKHTCSQMLACINLYKPSPDLLTLCCSVNGNGSPVPPVFKLCKHTR